MSKDQVVVLGDRRYVPVGESTVEHDFWTMGLIRRAGLDRFTLEPGESPEDFAVRTTAEVLASGQVLLLLGAFIKPEGERDWTPELAEETAQFVGGLTSEGDKLRVRQTVLSLLIDFFEQGISSLWSSAPASSKAALELVPRADRMLTPTESGPRWFGRSPSTTSTRRAA